MKGTNALSSLQPLQQGLPKAPHFLKQQHLVPQTLQQDKQTASKSTNAPNALPATPQYRAVLAPPASSSSGSLASALRQGVEEAYQNPNPQPPMLANIRQDMPTGERHGVPLAPELSKAPRVPGVDQDVSPFSNRNGSPATLTQNQLLHPDERPTLPRFQTENKFNQGQQSASDPTIARNLNKLDAFTAPISNQSNNKPDKLLPPRSQQATVPSTQPMRPLQPFPQKASTPQAVPPNRDATGIDLPNEPYDPMLPAISHNGKLAPPPATKAEMPAGPQPDLPDTLPNIPDLGLRPVAKVMQKGLSPAPHTMLNGPTPPPNAISKNPELPKMIPKKHLFPYLATKDGPPSSPPSRNLPNPFAPSSGKASSIAATPVIQNGSISSKIPLQGSKPTQPPKTGSGLEWSGQGQSVNGSSGTQNKPPRYGGAQPQQAGQNQPMLFPFSQSGPPPSGPQPNPNSLCKIQAGNPPFVPQNQPPFPNLAGPGDTAAALQTKLSSPSPSSQPVAAAKKPTAPYVSPHGTPPSIKQDKPTFPSMVPGSQPETPQNRAAGPNISQNGNPHIGSQKGSVLPAPRPNVASQTGTQKEPNFSPAVLGQQKAPVLPDTKEPPKLPQDRSTDENSPAFGKITYGFGTPHKPLSNIPHDATTSAGQGVPGGSKGAGKVNLPLPSMPRKAQKGGESLFPAPKAPTNLMPEKPPQISISARGALFASPKTGAVMPVNKTPSNLSKDNDLLGRSTFGPANPQDNPPPKNLPNSSGVLGLSKSGPTIAPSNPPPNKSKVGSSFFGRSNQGHVNPPSNPPKEAGPTGRPTPVPAKSLIGSSPKHPSKGGSLFGSTKTDPLTVPSKLQNNPLNDRGIAGKQQQISVMSQAVPPVKSQPNGGEPAAGSNKASNRSNVPLGKPAPVVPSNNFSKASSSGIIAKPAAPAVSVDKAPQLSSGGFLGLRSMAPTTDHGTSNARGPLGFPKPLSKSAPVKTPKANQLNTGGVSGLKSSDAKLVTAQSLQGKQAPAPFGDSSSRAPPPLIKRGPIMGQAPDRPPSKDNGGFFGKFAGNGDKKKPMVPLPLNSQTKPQQEFLQPKKGFFGSSGKENSRPSTTSQSNNARKGGGLAAAAMNFSKPRYGKGGSKAALSGTKRKEQPSKPMGQPPRTRAKISNLITFVDGKRTNI